jgi:hypothetical protein
VYREQPDIHFKHEYLLIVETDKLEAPVICSTYEYFSQLIKEHNHCTMIKVLYQLHLIFSSHRVKCALYCPFWCNILKYEFHFQSREEDNNRDGKYDELYFEIQVQLLQNQDAHAVTLFLLFDYKLYVCIIMIFTSLSLSQQQCVHKSDQKVNQPAFLTKLKKRLWHIYIGYGIYI